MKFQAALFLIAIATTEVASSSHDRPNVWGRGLKSGAVGKSSKAGTIEKGAPTNGDMVEKSSKASKTGDLGEKSSKAPKSGDMEKASKEPKHGKLASKEPKHGSDMTMGPKSTKESKGLKSAPKHTKGLESVKELKSKGSKYAKGDTLSKAPKHSKGLEGSKESKGGKESKGSKTTKMPCWDAVMTTKKTKAPKSKGAKSSNVPSGSDDTPTTANCPFDERRALKASKSKSAKSTAAPAVPLDDVWGQDPGTQIVISLASNPTYCIQPAGLSIGQGLEAVPCTYNDEDAYTIDAYGQLHTSDPDLCVTGAGSDLVLDVCDVCGAVFQFDPAGFTIKAVYADTPLFWTTVSGDLFLLEEMEMSVIRAKQMMIEDTQQFLVIPFLGETVAPTLTYSPTACDTDLPTSSSPPSSM